MAKQKLEEIKKLLNDLNLGTQKVDLGQVFVDLVERVEALEAKVADLEAAAG